MFFGGVYKKQKIYFWRIFLVRDTLKNGDPWLGCGVKGYFWSGSFPEAIKNMYPYFDPKFPKNQKKKNFPSANQKLAFPKPSIEAKIRFFINTK